MLTGWAFAHSVNQFAHPVNSTCPLPEIAQFPGKTHYLSLDRSKIEGRMPTQPDIWAKVLKIAHPVNYSYSPP